MAEVERPTMQNYRDRMVIIIGAGLSGLLTGYRLKKAGISFEILEARDRTGGRIHTIDSAGSTPVEMGATWFGDQHPNLRMLLEELGIPYFEQYMQGTSFYQASPNSPATSIPIPNQPPSYRIAGGTSRLTEVLTEAIGENRIHLDQVVRRVDFMDNLAKVHTDKTYLGTHVVLSLPPKLWTNTIQFNPPMPDLLQQVSSQTHTWMEESIKAAVSYGKPFWRENKHSGALFSNSGPMTELYDHCNEEQNKFALCGFVHPGLGQLSAEVRKEMVIRQLVQVFGKEANKHIDYRELVWSNEDHTYAENVSPLMPHQNNGHPIYQNNYCDNRLLVSSSEASPSFPGYMEGAVVSANLTAEKLKAAK